MNQIIISCIYGHRHNAFAQAFIYSLQKTLPGCKVVIGYADFSLVEIQLLQITYPKVEFVALVRKKVNSPTHASRASQKIQFWLELSTYCANKNDQILFIDIDTLVIRNPFDAFSNNVDLVITRKLGKFTLNSGVLFAKYSENMVNIFNQWLIETNKILSSKSLNRKSEEFYGGADQSALIKVLNIGNEIKNFEEDFASERSDKLNIKFVSCTEFNQTESAELSELTRIIHFKAGWHKIITSKGKYTKNRPRRTSEEFHKIWRNHYQTSTKLLVNTIGEVITRHLQNLDLFHGFKNGTNTSESYKDQVVLAMIKSLKVSNLFLISAKDLKEFDLIKLKAVALSQDYSLNITKKENSILNFRTMIKNRAISNKIMDDKRKVKILVDKNLLTENKISAILLQNPKPKKLALLLNDQLLKSQNTILVIYVGEVKNKKRTGNIEWDKVFDRVSTHNLSDMYSIMNVESKHSTRSQVEGIHPDSGIEKLIEGIFYVIYPTLADYNNMKKKLNLSTFLLVEIRLFPRTLKTIINLLRLKLS
jgi:hypothetical protein